MSDSIDPGFMPAATPAALARVQAEVTACRRCPRLVAWREQVARDKVRRYRDELYWGKPVPAFGDPAARLVVLGLAPAAHGGNRTGRMFTGDDSGNWLMRALYRAGFANRPTSVDRWDGLALTDAWITAVVRCVPPDNRPTRQEAETCSPFFWRELDVLRPRVVVTLGHFAFAALRRYLRARGAQPVPAAGRFAHGASFPLVSSHGRLLVLASYHPSRQNTATGRLTESMLDAVFQAARIALTAADPS